MLCPRNVTPPPVIAAGAASSWAIANSSVDLPQPDSPTTPMNSPAIRSKLTSSTARTTPRSITYSTVRPLTSSMGRPGGGGAPGRWASRPGWPAWSIWSVWSGTLPPPPSHRPQRGVADLVEGIVEQGERRAQQGDAEPRGDRPHGLAGLQRGLVLGPVQHRAPALRVRVAQADELQAGREQHRVQRVGQEGGHD